MLIDDNNMNNSNNNTINSTSNGSKKDPWKFNFPFRAERIIYSPPPIMKNKDNKNDDGRTSYGKRERKSFDQTTFSPTTSASSSSSSNPTTPTTPSHSKHNYSDPTVYYVSRDFFAVTTEHLSVFLDDELELIEELPGGAWTRVKERDSQQIGLIPTEILESGAERLAKENKNSNQDAIRVMSCRSDQTGTTSSNKGTKNVRKSVSFCQTEPDVVHYPADHTNDHNIFPFTLEDDLTSAALASCQATSCDTFSEEEEPVPNDFTRETISPPDTAKKQGFLKKLFKSKRTANETSILSTLKDFEKYPDHLIRVYTGNLDEILHAYKTFIVDETLTFAEFTHMVLATFSLDTDGFYYELNLVNHLTAEVVALDLDFTIEQVIELTKREGLAFSKRMPKELRKVQKGALKRLQQSSSSASTTANRDKSTDYVTPFKFVINRTYNSVENVPIYVHVSLAYNNNSENSSSASNLIISSLFPQNETEAENQDQKKWYHKLMIKNKKSSANSDDNKSSNSSQLQSLHRIRIYTKDPLHILIHHLLETLECPQNLPEIAFEASLPAIHDAIELPLPINMPVGDVMKIRPKLDQSQQVIIIRPVIISRS